MKEIQLTAGFIALVDDSDFDWLMSMGRWNAKGGSHKYATRSEWVDELNRRRLVKMHRLLVPNAECVDHINGNTLDNRRSNLRKASKAENAQNRRGWAASASGFKGVQQTASKANPWRATIAPAANSRPVHLGVFKTAAEAAHVYDAAAKRYFGDFAWLNFPEED